MYWSRIRKFVTYRIGKNVTENRQRTHREQTENRETNYRGHSNPRWIVGLSGPIYVIGVR